jgi:hypothetical protein
LLQLGDVADRTNGGAADLAHPLGQDVDAALQLVALLVEQQVVVAEVRAADVPMEVLGLHIERERVGHECVERGRNLADRFGRQIGRGVEPGRSGVRVELSYLGGHGGTSCEQGLIGERRRVRAPR